MAALAETAGVALSPAQFPSDTFTIHAVVARPARSAGGAPAVLVLHEWWGLNDQIQGVARRLAEAGFAACAPNLYSRFGGRVTQSPQEAASLMSALSAQAILRDLNAATKFLTTQPSIDPQRIGVLGFSMGGTFALTQAAHHSDLKAAVAFYGKVPPIETLDYLLCPVQYHYAAKDAWVTRQEMERLAQGMRQYGKSGEVHVYPEADHAFFNETRPEVYRVEEARLAWDRTLQFLSTYL